MGTSRLPIVLGGVAGIAAIATGFALGEGLTQQWGLAARYTARVGFPLFLLTYVASALVRLWPGQNTRTLLANRRNWGLGFAVAHSIHLVALIIALKLSGEGRPLPVLLVGGFAYVLMFAMALTSNARAMRAMGRWWKRLHRVGIHLLWAVFTFSYAGRAFDADARWPGAVFFILCLAAFALRLAATARSKHFPATGH